MGFVLSEEQQLLKDSASEFLAAKAPISALRRLRDDKDDTGFCRELWSEMAEMGWAGIVIPEEYGGLGFGFQGLGLVLEEAGKTLTASPLVSTVLLGANAVMLGGTEAQKSALLPKIAEGSLLMALALEEKAHHDPAATAMKADKDGDGYRLDGSKVFVLDGHVADTLVVAARTSGQPGDEDGLTLFLVDGNARGVTRQRTFLVDSRAAANISFEGVAVAADNVLGTVDQGFGLLDQVIDRAAIGLAAEMLGSSQAAFDMTLDYLKTRRQFGQLIGSFQALQHRAAVMFSELELLRSCVTQALSAVDEGRNDVSALASLAKARASETFHLVAREGVQMHGGIGMTDEHDIGFYLKRSQAAETAFGNAGYHRERYARLTGF